MKHRVVGSSASLTHMPAEMPEELSHLDMRNLLGYGAYAQVVAVRDINTGTSYALKIVEKEQMISRQMIRQLAIELGGQKFQRHPNIVRAIDLFEDDTHAYMTLELCSHGSVFQAAQSFPRCIIPEHLSSCWLCDASRGAAYLHELGLIHRDIKLENLLLNDENRVMLCDLGWCAFEADEPSGVCGTPNFAAPEVNSNGIHTQLVDSWAIGACLVQFLSGQPIAGPHAAVMPRGTPPAARDLGEALLVHDPAQRLAVRDALQMPFLAAAGVASAGEELASDLPAATVRLKLGGSLLSMVHEICARLAYFDPHRTPPSDDLLAIRAACMDAKAVSKNSRGKLDFLLKRIQKLSEQAARRQLHWRQSLPQSFEELCSCNRLAREMASVMRLEAEWRTAENF